MVDSGSLRVFSTTAFLSAFLYTRGPVNAVMYDISIYIRTALLLLAIAVSLVVFFRERTVSRKSTYILLIVLAFGAIHFPRDNVNPTFVTALVFSMGAIFLPYVSSAAKLSAKTKTYDLFIIAVGFYLLFLALASGVSFTGLFPEILFSYINDEIGRPYYSQGVSNIFAVGIIAIVFKITHESVPLYFKIGLSVAALLFFSLALAGGGRGEIVFCLVTVMFMFSRSWKHLVIGGIALGLIFVVVMQLLENSEMFAKLPTISRFVYAYGNADLGGRDYFLDKSIELLGQEPSCLVTGCGLMFFQNYYHYEFGDYPHNWAIEFFITFGLVVFVVLCVALLVFFVRHHKEFSLNDKFLCILSMYFFGIALKSGSLIGDPLLYGSLFPVLFSVWKPHAAAARQRLRFGAGALKSP